MSRHFHLRRLFLSLLLTALLLSACQRPIISADGAAAHRVALCHLEPDGTHLLIDDTLGAFASHLLHGDGVPSGAAPARPGFVFTPGCAIVSDVQQNRCPPGMARVEWRSAAPSQVAGAPLEPDGPAFCIDRWEAHLTAHSPYRVPPSNAFTLHAATAPLVIPQAYISADVAAAACQASGKRLCSSAEWLRACSGPPPLRERAARPDTSSTRSAPPVGPFPYGRRYVPGACNEGRTTHPVIELFGDETDWSPEQMNDPRLNRLRHGLARTGSYAACMSVEGVFDLHGNLHEWVSDAEGTFRGGFYVDAKINGAGCQYKTTAHNRGYHDYSTGFRCCASAE